MIKKFSLIFLSMILMSACTSSSIRKLSDTSGTLKYAQTATLSPDLVNTVNTLAFLLQDNNADQNQFMSSLSIYLALAMTSHGTEGVSYDQFMALLNPKQLDETAWLAQLKTLQGNLNAMEKVKIVLANSLWIRDSFAENVKEDFLQRNKDYFGAMVAAVDFNDPQSLEDINAWVKQNTNKLIEKALDQIDPDTIMFLINTIYFKGNWVSPFEENKTIDKTFHGITDKTVKFMTQIGSFKYAENDDYQAILLPYEGNSTGMLLVMGKDDPIQLHSNADFMEVMASLQSSSIALTMPKVDIATTQVLNGKLSALGLSDPFMAGIANFSRLSDAELFISKVLHKARLKIDEKGTEAAAVTIISVDVTSIPISDHEMTIDHPFQVYIVDLNNDLILFSGLLNDVQASE